MAIRDVAAERSDVDREVAGITVCHVFERNVTQWGDKPALSWKENGTWQHLTWREYRERVAEVTMGLRRAGVGKGDFVAIMAKNRPEHLIADMAALHARAIPVSFYNTFAPEQIRYIAAHCGAKVAILEDPEFLQRWEKVRPELPDLQGVYLIEGADEAGDSGWVSSWADLASEGADELSSNRAAFEEGWRDLSPDEPATIIYTSGTTGDPKGVITTHLNAVWTAASMNRLLEYDPQGKYVSYLPLAHSAERMATMYVGLYVGSWVHFCAEVMDVFTLMPEVKPRSFVGVPRVWEKLQAGVMAKLQAEPNERKRNIALKAIDTARRATHLELEGKPVPLGLRLQRAVLDKLVLSKVRAGVGLDECDVPITGAAPISIDTHEFFQAIGVPLYELYGLTETTAPATANREEARRVGTVGWTIPGVEAKLLEDGELLLRGGNISPGYYKEPEITAQTLDDEGWLHTGDIAEIDDQGFIKIVDRKKEIIITAAGKNIAPSNIEGHLKHHPLVAQACALGDVKPFISALIVLDAEAAPLWAEKNGIEFTSIEEFSRNPSVYQEVERAVAEANEHVARVEQVKKFVILPTEWTLTSDELTPSLKMKRRVIHEKYAKEIEDLYA